MFKGNNDASSFSGVFCGRKTILDDANVFRSALSIMQIQFLVPFSIICSAMVSKCTYLKHLSISCACYSEIVIYEYYNLG